MVTSRVMSCSRLAWSPPRDSPTWRMKWSPPRGTGRWALRGGERRETRSRDVVTSNHTDEMSLRPYRNPYPRRSSAFARLGPGRSELATPHQGRHCSTLVGRYDSISFASLDPRRITIHRCTPNSTPPPSDAAPHPLNS